MTTISLIFGADWSNFIASYSLGQREKKNIAGSCARPQPMRLTIRISPDITVLCGHGLSLIELDSISQRQTRNVTKLCFMRVMLKSVSCRQRALFSSNMKIISNGDSMVNDTPTVYAATKTYSQRVKRRTTLAIDRPVHRSIRETASAS
jgi:hypothetical protein